MYESTEKRCWATRSIFGDRHTNFNVACDRRLLFFLYVAVRENTAKPKRNIYYYESGHNWEKSSQQPPNELRRGAEISCLSNYSLKQLNKLYYVLLFLFYCIFLPNRTLQIPSHSFITVTFFSSTNKYYFLLFYRTSNSRGTIFSECRCFLTWWERMESITERLYVGTLE